MEKRKNDRIGNRALYIMMLLVTAISGLSVSSLGPDTAYAAETAPAGYYGMYFTAFGSDETAECVDMRVAVFDEDGVTLGEFVMSSQDFGDPDDVWETKYVEAYFERPPATIDISCYYKNKLAGDEDFGRISYRTQFGETDGEVTAADEFTGFEFCSYSITHISDDETLHYVDANGNDHVQDEYIVVNGPEIGEKGKESWYALRYEIDTQMVTVSGNVNLVLCDSHSLKSDGGIVIEPGSSLTIWGQKNGTGTIKAIGEDVETDIFSYAAGAPGIEVDRSSSLTINGGTIIAQAGRYSAGIGSRGDDTSGSITINGGKVTATGGSCKEIDGPWDEISEESQRSGAGIGGGAGGSNGPIVITGGEVIAKAGEKGTGGAGIGSGTGASSGPITITGGYVKAEGKNYGAGIGSGARAPSGTIIIDSKGTVDAESVAGAGIGSGGRRYENDSNNNGPITISAGTVNARSGSTDKNFSGSGAAIGSGRGGRQVGDIVISGGVVNAVCMGRSAGIGGSANDNDGFAGGNITISGKYTKVTAVSVGGAGIGSGGRNVGVDSLNASGASGGNITIDDGTVIAVSTGAGAGIGGGNGGSGGSITINGGDVKAYGGNSEYKWKDEGSGSQGGTGISGIGDVIDGLMRDDFYDMISDVIIDALFSDTFSGAGIGGGSHAEGGTVVINGGIVEATAGTNEAKAIGYGRTNSDKGSLTLYENSKVTYGNYQGEKIEAEGVDQSETRHTYAQNNSYAKIEPGDITVSFDVGEHGQAPEDQIVVRGETASEPDDPQADGYFFGGWYIDEGCTESYDFSAPVMKSITLHARWLKARAITIVKDWGGAEPADSVTITYDNEYSPGRSTSGTLQLSADNEWKGTITASDDSILTFGEEEVSGFRTGDYTLGEDIKLPSADKAGSARLVLRDQENSGLSQEAFDEACSIVKSGSAVITLSNHRTRVYSVKKTWDLPQRQSDYKPESVKAVLQHGEGDSWKTVQTVTLSEKNGWSENFEPVDDDSREAFDGWRIRELDEDGKKVPDASDEDGSGESSARFHISPYTDTEFDMTYEVSYEEDTRNAVTEITNKAGTMTVKKEWASSAEGVDPLRPESIKVVLQKKVGSAGETWQTVETAQLSEENDWKYEFNAVQYQADGTFDAEDFRIRELGEGTLLSDGDVILDPTDADYQQDEATVPVVEYEVTAGDKTEKIPYQVSYERKGDVTTITNTVSYLKAEKKWDIDLEGKDHPDSVEIIAQKKIGDKWETIGTAQLSDENEWKTNIPVAEKPGGDTQYRVRELKAKSAMESITEPLGITETEKRIVYDKDDNDKPQSDEDDNTTNIVIYKVESYTSALTGEEKSHKTEYMVSYKEEDGTYTVTNKAIIGVDIVKNWFRAGDVDEEDMPDSVWLVLMCSPKAGALDNARDLAEAAGVDLSKVLDYEFPVINPIEGGKDPVSLIGELALGVDIGIFDKVSTVPKLAIAKADKDEEDSKKNWRVHFVNSKYVSGIPMEYKGAELSSEALRQIVKYVTKIDLPVSYNPFDGYISIPTKASSSFDNWKITDLDLSKLKEAGGNLTQQDLDAVKSALGASDTNLATSVFNVKVDIDLDEDDDEQPDENTITGKVLWNDDDDRDGIRPDKVKVELLENGEVAASAETSEAAGWKFFFPERPKQKDGKDIEYAITEDTTDVITGADGPGTYAFEVTRDYDDGFTVTNTHSPSTVDIRGKKTWEDADDQDGVRPQNIFIRLFADGRELDIQTVNAAKDWKWSFEGKPKYKDGKEIIYTIKEDEVEGYSSEVTGYDVTNTHEPEVTDVTVTKKWEDESDHDGRRPSSVTLQLRADGRIAAEHEVTAEDDWKWTFSDQPVYEKGEKINYTAGERDIEDYTGTVDGLTITNKYEIGKTQVNVYKEWADDNDRDGIRPESVKVCLLADGEDTGKTLTLDAAHSWAGTFSSLDEYAQGGRKIVYSVEEIPGDIPSGDEGYTSRITGSPEEGFIITNSHEPGTVDIKGGKTWEDDEDKAGQRPESIVIHLLANGSEADVRTVTEEDGWTWTFEGLPQREKGQDISYTINEDPVEGYESEVHGFDVTNTYIPMCTITYDLNGGAFEGSAENIIEKYRTGTTIAIHQAPERDGYEFTHWQGSSYQPGDEYKVTEDHIFTAQWEKKDTPPDDEDDPPGDDPEDDDPGDGPGDDPGDNPGGDAPSGGDPHHDSPGMGDRSDIMLWIMVMMTSLMSLLVAHALHRKS